MDTDRFDRMSRVAGIEIGRRGFSHLIAILGMLWGIGLHGENAETVAKNRKKRKKNKKRKNKKTHSVTCASGEAACGQACFPECCPGSSRPCYSGPEGTRDVGVCRDGEQFCQAAGTWSNVCGGQVTPSIELCNGLDDDCDGNVDEGADVVLCNSELEVCEEGRCCRPVGASCQSGGNAVCCSGNCEEVIINLRLCQP